MTSETQSPSGADGTDERVLREVFRLERERFEVPAAPDAPFLKEQVIYGKAGERELLGTLYRPKSPSGSLCPVVVYIHGGGWKGGTRAQFPRHAAAMTEKGFVGLCIDYRLSGEAPYPAAIHDCKCAVRYVREHASGLNIDPDRIGAVGGSAGAHLSAILATTPSRAEWEGEGGWPGQSSSVQAAVLFNGEFDLPAWWHYGKCNDLMLRFLGTPYAEDPELYRLVSPIAHVDAHTPPCLLLHGEEDEPVPIAQSIDFCAKILAAGGRAELIRVPGVGHAWFNRDPHFERCLAHMMDFLVRHLSASSAPVSLPED